MASPTDRSVTPVSPNPAVFADESKGSSVSTVLREEYEDLLRYAVVTPLVDSKVVKHTHSPERNNHRSPRGDSRMETVIRTTHHLGSPRKTEVKYVDVPGSSSSSDSSTLQNDHTVEESCSSVLSEHPKQHTVHCAKPSVKFSHSVSSTPNVTPLPTCNRLAMSACEGVTHSVGLPHRHCRQVHCESVDVGKGMGMGGAGGGECAELREKQQQHCHAHFHHHVCEGDTDGVQELVADPEMNRLGQEMDACWVDLKKKVSAEFEQSRIRVIESQQARLLQEREKRMMEMNLLREEVCRYKEMGLAYEHSLCSKDQIIENLTLGLHKAKEKHHKQHTFSMWHNRHIDEKREKFCSVLASKHHRRKMLGRVLAAWHGLIKHTWKLRTEKACQLKAEEVCLELTQKYEEQMEHMKKALEESEHKCVQFRSERDSFEADVKKAFMRGVCALNLEAMTVLKSSDSDQTPAVHQTEAPPPPPAHAHSRVVTDSYRRTHTTSTASHLPMLNVEGKGLMNGSGSSTPTQDAWSRLSKWAESLGPPPTEWRNHGDKGNKEYRVEGSGRGPESSRGNKGLVKSTRPTHSGTCTIKGTVKGYLRPTVVIEKHSD